MPSRWQLKRIRLSSIYMYVHEYICIVTTEEEDTSLLFFCGNNTNIFMYIHVYPDGS